MTRMESLFAVMRKQSQTLGAHDIDWGTLTDDIDSAEIARQIADSEMLIAMLEAALTKAYELDADVLERCVRNPNDVSDVVCRFLDQLGGRLMAEYRTYDLFQRVNSILQLTAEGI